VSAALLEASLPVAWKVRATRAITALRDAIGATAEELEQLDGTWGSLQRKLNFSLGIAAEDKDGPTREAATRLRDALLLGNGTAQNALGWEEEVDFGRQQLALTATGPLAADATKVGIKPLLQDIDTATEALAHGLGRGPGQKSASSRATRRREALVECTTAFNSIHDELAWFVANTEDGEARAKLEQMLAPLQALLERHPIPAEKKPTQKPSPRPTPTPTPQHVPAPDPTG
jgi:hypothetical protein